MPSVFVFKNKFSLLCGYTFGFFPFIFSAASPFIFLADLVCTYSDYQLYIITRIKLQPFINCIFKGQTFIFETIINLRYYIIAVSFLTTPLFYICIRTLQSESMFPWGLIPKIILGFTFFIVL